MSKSDAGKPRGARRAVALSYGGGEGAPVLVASGMGYLAEKIVEVASESGVPVYEDNSLATILSQLQLGQEIPESLYRAIVDIYIYFLEFDPVAAGVPAPAAPKEEKEEKEEMDEQESEES